MVHPAPGPGELSGAGFVRALANWLPVFMGSGAQQPPLRAPDGGVGAGRVPSFEARDAAARPADGGGDAARSPLSSGGGGDLFKRSAEITTVSRIGRESSVLRVRARTLSDRDPSGGRDLIQRIRVASEAAADPLFDFEAYHNLHLAGMGTVPTFHFLAGGERHGGFAASAGPDLSGLVAVSLPPA